MPIQGASAGPGREGTGPTKAIVPWRVEEMRQRRGGWRPGVWFGGEGVSFFMRGRGGGGGGTSLLYLGPHLLGFEGLGFGGFGVEASDLVGFFVGADGGGERRVGFFRHGVFGDGGGGEC